MPEVKEDEDNREEDSGVEELQYAIAEDYPVQDNSILPVYLKTVCQGKETNWLERTTEGEQPPCISYQYTPRTKGTK